MTAVIDNDTLGGMPALGSDIGDFLGNLAPGVGKFIIVIGIFGGIVSIIAAIVTVIIMVVKKNA